MGVGFKNQLFQLLMDSAIQLSTLNLLRLKPREWTPGHLQTTETALVLPMQELMQ
jgi:hypothetical protein